MLQLPLDIQLDDSAKFDNYFIGENHQLVDRLTNLRDTHEDFIFIWGAEGVGKSHLAQSVCHSLAASEKTIAYFPVNNPNIGAEYLENLENIDLICIDGFEFIASKRDWEEALFNLYNQLKSHRRQLVIFSQSSPIQMPILLKDLKSRLGDMEIYKLKSISDRQKVEFLMEYGRSRGLGIAEDVADFILARTNREVRDIQSVVKNLDKQALAQKRRITIPFVKNVLGI